MKAKSNPTLPLLTLDRSQPVPLYWQLYGELQRAILSRQLSAGARLPSSREMAATLGISRNTVKDAYEQLIAEGYLHAGVGSGTYVTNQLPDELLNTRNAEATRQTTLISGSSVSRENQTTQRAASLLGEALRPIGSGMRQTAQIFSTSPFAISRPALDAFPLDVWTRIATSVHKRLAASQLGTGHDPMGYQPLREAIAAHLRAVRGMNCTAEQIMIVSGSQKGLYITARALISRGAGVWLEEPGYGGVQGVARIVQGNLSLVPVDEQGLNVDTGIEMAKGASVAYVTPSHQFPLGVTMSLLRRLQLLHWAEQAGSWLIEDDYDSEFRYSGHPLAALHGLDTNDRVIYVGTFSKVMFPALRLGYIVLPTDLTDVFVGVKIPIDRHPSLAVQMMVNAFMEQGHFTRHLRRMLGLYTERRDALVEAVECKLTGALTLGPSDCGMHVAGWLASGLDETAIVARASEKEIGVVPLSSHYLGEDKREGVLLGFTSASPTELRRGIETLASIIETVS